MNRNSKSSTKNRDTVPLDGARLSQAIDKAGISLRHILGDPTVQLVLVGNNSQTISQQVQDQWGSDEEFGYSKHLGKTNPDTGLYILALYMQDRLCGISTNKMRRYVHGASFPELTAIKGCPTDHPLKGLVITAFSQANFEIAQEFDFPQISVMYPKDGTKNAYLRIGYDHDHASEINRLNMMLFNGVIINWGNAMEHQRSKGRAVPTGYQSPATP